jgi:NTE family protein
MRRALVLGGGGPAAYAWEIGFVAGLADEGVDIRSAHLLVGTSSGARLAVELASDVATSELIARPYTEAPRTVDVAAWRDAFARAKDGLGGVDALKRLGELGRALASSKTKTTRAFVPTDMRWPTRDVVIAAVDATTGQRRAFRRGDGVPLGDALAASSAIPGIDPLADVDGHPYMNGGTYSLDNADLAAGYDRVLVLSMRPSAPGFALVGLDDGMKKLAMSGARAESILPDAATEKALASHDDLVASSVHEPAARTGRAQGRVASSEIASFWG